MTLGERIKACRQSAGLSQEKVAELAGVSRQAVAKWEANQSAPSTEHLLLLADIFETTVERLLASGEEVGPSPAEQLYAVYRREEEKKAARRKQARKRNLRHALGIVLGYLALYLAGRVFWCDLSQSSLLGWLFTERPSGTHSYLYGWLLDRKLYWYAMAISALPALFGRFRFARTTAAGFALGLAAGMLFGPNPAGAALGHDHYGWAIWGAVFLASIAAGAVLERRVRAKRDSES